MVRQVLIVVSVAAASAVAAVVTSKQVPAREPSICATMWSPYARGRTEPQYHGTWVAARDGAEAGRISWQSAFQAVPTSDLRDLEEKLELQRRDPVLARTLDRKIEGASVAAYRENPLLLWRLNDAATVQVSEARAHMIATSWPAIDAVVNGGAVPSWAAGQMSSYLRATALCEAMLLAGKAMNVTSGAEQSLWRQRWEILGRRVAALDPSLWARSLGVDSEYYPDLVHMKRRQFGLEPAQRAPRS